MSIVTITVSDLDLAEDTYKVEMSATGSQIDEGVATAAYFTAYYLHKICNEESFIEGAGEYGRGLIEAMVGRAQPTERAVMRLVMEDTDLVAGRFTPRLEMVSGDFGGEELPTSAQIVCAYMRSLLHRQSFMNDCWDYAREMVQEMDEASIANLEHAPNANDDTNDSAAA